MAFEAVVDDAWTRDFAHPTIAIKYDVHFSQSIREIDVLHRKSLIEEKYWVALFEIRPAGLSCIF